MFKGYRLGSVLTKDIAFELLQSPMDLYHRQGFFWFSLNPSEFSTKIEEEPEKQKKLSFTIYSFTIYHLRFTI